MNDSPRPSYEELLEQLLVLQKRLAHLEALGTTRAAAEQAFQESEEKFRVISEQSMMGILVFQDDRIRFVNQALAKIAGYEIAELLTWPSEDAMRRLIHPDDFEFVLDQLQRKMRGDPNVVTNYAVRILTRDQAVRWVEVYSKTVMVRGRPADLVTIADITDRKRAEEDRAHLQAQILHTQKLDGLSLLASGVAHDFNNILCGVLGGTELALQDLEAEHPARKNMEGVHRAAEQATELCRQMLAYAGNSHPRRESVDLTELIEDMSKLFELSLAESTTVELRLMSSPPLIHADASQLRQVILNLALNASESLEGRPGSVVVETGVEDCTHEMLRSAWLDEELPEGSYLYLDVRDQGRGMDKATLTRIFDPFFSTKFSGRGLGLASSLGIIRGHQGTVEVSSRPREGTHFRVRFPTEETTAYRRASATASGKIATGGAVLLVDDEETVRLVTQRMLESLGFVVMSFSEGEKALAFYSANAKAIRFALVDMNMPGMGGEEVLMRLREKNPELPVLLTSGFDEEEASRPILDHGKVAFLAKPFGLEALKLGTSQLLGELELPAAAEESSS